MQSTYITYTLSGVLTGEDAQISGNTGLKDAGSESFTLTATNPNYTGSVTTTLTIKSIDPTVTWPVYSGTYYEDRLNTATDYTTAPGDDMDTECGPVTKTDLILHLKTELKLLVLVLLLPAQGAGPPTPASQSPGGCEPRPVPHGFNLPHANTHTTCFTVQIKSIRHHGAG